MTDKQALQEVLQGQWGTIGPRSIAGAEQLCALTGFSYGVTTFSITAALEALLRGLNIGYGDRVMVASYSNAVNAMAVAAIGATPVFADIDLSCGIPTEQTAKAAWCDGIVAVLTDAPYAHPEVLETLRRFCHGNGAKLLLNLQNSFDVALTVEHLPDRVDAVAVDIGDPLLCPGVHGGAFLTGDRAILESGFAFHNCGRAFGDGCTLDMGDVIGGDLRIAEWEACLLESAVLCAKETCAARLASSQALAKKLVCSGLTPLTDSACTTAQWYLYDPEKNNGLSRDAMLKAWRKQGIFAERGYTAMHRQPFFRSDYFAKLTGVSEHYGDDGLAQSLVAERMLIKCGAED